jgi:hypothetical protein
MKKHHTQRLAMAMLALVILAYTVWILTLIFQ